MKSDTVYARAQATILRSSGHSVQKIATFFNKTERWVNKWSKECFQDEAKKRATFWFDQLCSKINQESEVQTEQFNK